MLVVLLVLLALTFYMNTHPERQYQHSADTPIRAQPRPQAEPLNLDPRRQGGHSSVEAARQAVATAQHQLHQAQADLARATADSPRSEEGAVATLVQPLHTAGAAALTPELTEEHPTMRLSPDPPIPTEVSTAVPTNPPATDAPSGPPTAPATDEPTTSRTLELKSCGVVADVGFAIMAADVGSGDGRNVAACCASCSSHPRCKAWTWVKLPPPATSGGSCWLKRDMPNVFPQNDAITGSVSPQSRDKAFADMAARIALDHQETATRMDQVRALAAVCSPSAG